MVEGDGDINDKIMCPVSAQVRKYKATLPLPFSSKILIFSILANNSLFCVGFHLSVNIKMLELDCS